MISHIYVHCSKKNCQLGKVISFLKTLQCNTLSTQISQALNNMQQIPSFFWSFSTSRLSLDCSVIFCALWNYNVVDSSDFMTLTLLIFFKRFWGLYYAFFVMYAASLFLSWYTNAYLKVSLYIRIHLKIIPWNSRILNPNKSRVMYPLSLRFFRDHPQIHFV